MSAFRNTITDGFFTDEWEISFNGEWVDFGGIVFSENLVKSQLNKC